MNIESLVKDELRESDRLEAKSAANGLPRSIWETYSSFSNTSGGTILLGVSEDPVTKRLRVTGVEDPDAMVRQFWDIVNNKEKVSSVVLKEDDVRIIRMDGMAVVAIEVPRVNRRFRPVYINNDLSEGTFRRNSDGDYRCTFEEVKEMLRDAGDVSADRITVDDLGPEALDTDTVNRYRSLIRSYRPDHPWLQLETADFLETVGAMSADKDGVPHPTGAGLLMFGKERYITKEFPNYFLDYRETSGESRWSYRLFSQSGDWSGNIFDFLGTVSPRLSLLIGSEFRMEGFYRKDRSAAALAVREALVNALIHSDYYGRQGLVVEASRHRVTVSNPGTFRIPPSKAARGGVSDPRNSGLMKMALVAGMVEHIGSGVREMEEAVRSGALADLAIEESFDPSRVRTVLDLGGGPEGLTGDEARVIAVIEGDPEARITDIARETGKSVSTVNRILGGLKAKGLVSRIGGARGGHWILHHI